MTNRTPIITFYQGDCMNFMRDKPDGFWKLAIVDPPYGVGDWQTVGDPSVWDLKAQKKYGSVHWNDYTPGIEYFTELKRVSKEQIIWGANYYNQFSESGGAIVWDKKMMQIDIVMVISQVAHFKRKLLFLDTVGTVFCKRI